MLGLGGVFEMMVTSSCSCLMLMLRAGGVDVWAGLVGWCDDLGEFAWVVIGWVGSAMKSSRQLWLAAGPSSCTCEGGYA